MILNGLVRTACVVAFAGMLSACIGAPSGPTVIQAPRPVQNPIPIGEGNFSCKGGLAERRENTMYERETTAITTPYGYGGLDREYSYLKCDRGGTDPSGGPGRKQFTDPQ